jgi:hypothetical protein
MRMMMMVVVVMMTLIERVPSLTWVPRTVCLPSWAGFPMCHWRVVVVADGAPGQVGARGFYRTAFEVARLLLSLDPGYVKLDSVPHTQATEKGDLVQGQSISAVIRHMA